METQTPTESIVLDEAENQSFLGFKLGALINLEKSVVFQQLRKRRLLQQGPACRGDQYCTDSAAQIRAVLCQIDGPDHMLTSIECRSQAEEKITQAEREPRHRTRLLTAAQAWLILAGQMRRLEATISGTGEIRSKIRAD
jgi:hypothetical protein